MIMTMTILNSCSITVHKAHDPAVREENGMDIVEAFKPERWLNEDTKPTEYMPWGIGPRFCLGYNLATVRIQMNFHMQVPFLTAAISLFCRPK